MLFIITVIYFCYFQNPAAGVVLSVETDFIGQAAVSGLSIKPFDCTVSRRRLIGSDPQTESARFISSVTSLDVFVPVLSYQHRVRDVFFHCLLLSEEICFKKCLICDMRYDI